MKNQRQWRAWAKKFTANAGNNRAPKPIEFKNVAGDVPVEILIYDQIGSDWYGDGCSARDFAVALAAIPQEKEITVCINSPGGCIADGLAIYNLLLARKDKVTCRVDGMAASIASVIALAVKECVMAEASIMMIHDASGCCMGTADDMEEMAAALKKHTNLIAGIYARKTGKPVAEMNAAMTAETWLTGPEAVEFGLADCLTTEDEEPISDAKSASAQTTKQNPAGAKGNGGAISNTMNRTQVIALLNKLGLKFEDGATDESLAALLENYSVPTPPAPSAPDISSEVQKVNRITNAVQKCATELRIPGSSVESFTARCLKDESFLAELQALHPRQVGAEPVTGVVPDAKAKSMKLEAYNKLTASDKKKFCLEGGKITD